MFRTLGDASAPREAEARWAAAVLVQIPGGQTVGRIKILAECEQPVVRLREGDVAEGRRVDMIGMAARRNGVEIQQGGRTSPRAVSITIWGAKDSKTCTSITFGQVAAVGEMALFIGSLGSSDAAMKAATGPQKAIKAAQAAGKVKKSYNASQTLKNAVTEEDMIWAAAQITAIADPSGVSSTVAAYTYPKCSKYFGPVKPNKASKPTKSKPTQTASRGSVKWASSTGRMPRNTFMAALSAAASWGSAGRPIRVARTWAKSLPASATSAGAARGSCLNRSRCWSNARAALLKTTKRRFRSGRGAALSSINRPAGNPLPPRVRSQFRIHIVGMAPRSRCAKTGAVQIDEDCGYR